MDQIITNNKHIQMEICTNWGDIIYVKGKQKPVTESGDIIIVKQLPLLYFQSIG